MSQFTKEEVELLAHGFGYFVQEFPIPDDDPCYSLLDKLYTLRDAAPVVPPPPTPTPGQVPMSDYMTRRW